MLIIADENMPLAAELFGRHGEVRLKPGRGLSAADVRGADALLVRSITTVDAALLAGSRLRFVGSATIGTDHLDLPWLAGQGIAWANAPGCNAEAVAEYVLACLLILAERQGFALAGKSVGIVGVGHVGSALQRKLAALGLALVLCDPPRAEREGQAGFAGLDETLACDIVSLHVPLNRGGPHPTWHLLDERRLRALRPGTLLINAARGGVVDNAALRAALEAGQALTAVLDVWEDEPRPDPALAARVALASPHIAGYSLDGKLRGTLMIYEAFCRHFGLEAAAPRLDQLELPGPAPLRVTGSGEAALREAVLACYDPRRDDAAFRDSLAEAEPGAAFDCLRKHYPVRREFAALKLEAPAEAGWVEALGFSRA